MRLILTALVTGALTAGSVCADTRHDQTYAGQQTRAIASLSDADIAALEAGEGWGLAKPAELNGWPGPAHVLDLADALELTDWQLGVVTRIHGIMREEAQRVGARYIDSERALDAAFQSDTFDPIVLAGMTVTSANALAELRTIHLAAHIETRSVLTDHQIKTYNARRGYADGAAQGGHHGHQAQ